MVKAISDWIIGNLVLFGTLTAFLTFAISFIYDTYVIKNANTEKKGKEKEKQSLKEEGLGNEYITKMSSLANDLFSIADDRNKRVAISKTVAFVFLAISYLFLLVGGEMMNTEERLDVLEKKVGQIQETTLDFAERIQGLNKNAQMNAQQTQQIQKQIEKIFLNQALLVKMLVRGGMTAPGVEIIDSQPQVPRRVRFEINPEATRLDLTITE